MRTPSRFLSIFAVIAVLAGAFFATSGTVKAYESDTDGRISAEQVIDDDLLLSGEKVVMNGTVEGTLIASGQDVTVNGTVMGDAILFAQNVTVGEAASIQGNLIIGAQTVILAGKVGGSVFSGSMSTSLKSGALVARNLYFGGYSLDVAQAARIGRDLAAGGYQVILDGEVGRDVRASTAAFRLDGKVGRDFSVTVSEPSAGGSGAAPFRMPSASVAVNLDPGLVITGSASIGKDLAYTSPVPQGDQIAIQPGGETYYATPIPQQKPNQTGAAGTAGYLNTEAGKPLRNVISSFISIYAIGSLVLWLIPGLFTNLKDRIRQQPLPTAGSGVLVYIVGWVVFAVALLLVAVLSFLIGKLSLGGLGGITFFAGSAVWSVIFMVFIFMISIGGKVLVAYLAGEWIFLSIFKQPDANRFLVLLAGSLVYVIVEAIPVAGWLVGAVVVCLGLGAVWFMLEKKWKKPAAQEIVS